MENLINDDLDPSSFDESDNKSDHESFYRPLLTILTNDAYLFS